MPVSISKLANERQKVEVPVGDDVLNVVYNPAKFTIALEERIQDVAGDEFNTKAISMLLLEILVSWDLEDEGQAVPISEASLKVLPLPFLGKVLRYIRDDTVTGSDESGKGSADGSQQQEQSANSPETTTTTT